MRLHIIWIIYLKELREALRDRRTLFVMVGLPLLLYPLVVIGLTRIVQSRSEAQAAQATVQVPVAN